MFLNECFNIDHNVSYYDLLCIIMDYYKSQMIGVIMDDYRS